MQQKKTTLHLGWNFDNSYSRMPDLFYTKLNLSPVPSPKLIIINHSLSKSLGLDPEEFEHNEGVNILAGNVIPEGSFPLAQAYAGHQFGHFTLLGDGRALLYGEQITPQGERYDIQLKGSGRTPYSRGGDGRAALGPMLREYIMSEAMHKLGISTTRSLSVVSTGESIIRQTHQPGAILTRVAKSHIRVGTFEYVSKWGTHEDLQLLADYTIQRHFSYVTKNDNIYLSLLKEVIKLQANLISKWQLVGFIHGVMNTDNMSISGETIDYGPCAFIDTYDPYTVFSSIDSYGRYAYGNQPNIAQWNLARFAETLFPLIHPNKEDAKKLIYAAIEDFPRLYNNNWLDGMRAKLGLSSKEIEDELLINNLLTMMHKYKADYTNTFLGLTFNNLTDIALFDTCEFKDWHESWKARLNRQNESISHSLTLMKSSNPALIPRNHRVEESLTAAVNDENYAVMNNFLDALSNPYEHALNQIDYSKAPESSGSTYRTFCGT